MRVCSYCHLLLADSSSTCPHDGAQTRAAEVPPVPAQLHATLTDFEPYAQGQTGTCYLATQSASGYRGLLKVIPLAGVEASERVRLKRELRKQTRLAHDGLPRIVDGGELGKELWLFREHVPGESLAQRIKRFGKLEPSEALAITAQVASALDELQRNGLLHRDVKPGHVILQSASEGVPSAKLIDAGIAARLPTGSVFGLLGTPAYISPEQVAGKLVSFRSDLYALGCVLFEMLSGQPPFPDDDVQAVLEGHKSMPAPELELPLPSAARTLLYALLAKEPRQRPFSAQQVRRTLEPLLPPGTPLPALGTRATAAASQPAVRAAVAVPRPKGRAGVPPPPGLGAAPITEELELLEVISAPESQRGPKTLHLGDAELEELELREDADAASKPAPAGHAAMPDAAPVAQSAGGSDAVRQAVALDPDSDHAIVEPAVESSEAGSPAKEPSPAVVAGRRVVDFDVESLFDDGAHAAASPAAPTSLNEVAPTQIFRPRGEDAPAQGADAAAPSAARSSVRPPAAKGAPSSIPPVPKRNIKLPLALAGAAVVIGLLVMMVGRGKHASTDAMQTQGVSSAASPPASPPNPPAEHPPAAATVREPTPTQAHAEEPVAAKAAPAAKAERPSEAAAKVEAPAKSAPAAQVEQGAPKPEPAAKPATAPTPVEAKSAAGPSSDHTSSRHASSEHASAVLPAATAAGAPTDHGAEISAANAAGRSQTGAGESRLSQSSGPRTDRVTKADEYKAQAREHYQAGRFREAASAYEKATGLNPTDAGAFAGLAASRLAAGDAAAAVQAYSRAVRLQPDSSGFHAALGRAYLQKGDRDRARSAYQHALQLNPNNGAAKTALEQLK